MTNASGDFDYRGVWQAIEAERIARGLSRTAAVKDIHWLEARVINNLEHGIGTTCQHITGLLRWLGRSPESFMPGIKDRPEYAIPDVGPFAVRWSMPALYDAVDARRAELGMSWQQVGDELNWPTVKALKNSKYGIPMDLAMRVTRWLGQPAATFMYAAEPAPPGVKSATWGTAETT
ncbi:MAG: hypothetical protein QOF21_2449 [Actinomycetota bacterium]|jgi:hypothetical protein